MKPSLGLINEGQFREFSSAASPNPGPLAKNHQFVAKDSASG